MEDVSGDRSWITPDVVDAYFAPWRSRIAPTLEAYRAMAAAREPGPLLSKLSQVPMPVNPVIGTAPHYGAIEPQELRFMEAIPRYTVTRIPRAGHLIHEEKPEQVVAAVLRMRQELAGRQVVPATARSPGWFCLIHATVSAILSSGERERYPSQGCDAGGPLTAGETISGRDLANPPLQVHRFRFLRLDPNNAKGYLMGIASNWPKHGMAN